MIKNKRIVITIPAYNEAKTIGGLLKDIKQVMDKTDYSYQILVVNDGSKDKTALIAKDFGSIVVNHRKNMGLAQTFRTEMAECQKLCADIIVHIDGDGQYLPRDIPRLISKLENGYDLVLGSRFKGKIESMPLIKRLGNKAFSKVISTMAKIYISDGQTGFRAFTQEFANKIPITSTFTYTQEQIIRGSRMGYKIAEIPVYFAKREKSKSRLMKGPFDYARKASINLLRTYRDYEPIQLFGSFGFFFLILGLILGLYLIYQAITFNLRQDLAIVILDVLFITVGIQMIFFGLIADIFRK